MDVAVIGAGLAGLSCARALSADGLKVEVFDKGRGPGGRVATRRGDAGAFDHGAPVLHDLPPDLVDTYSDVLTPWSDGVIAQPRMSSLSRAMEAGLSVQQSARLTALTRRDSGWSIALEGARGMVAARTVLLCIPAPQVLDLLPDGLFPQIAHARMAPLWTLMLAFDERPSDVPDRVEAEDFTALRMAARPGRDASPDRWVIHAAQDWSQTHVEADRDRVEAMLLDAFCAATGASNPSHTALHRWLYGRTHRPAGQACFWSADHRIGVAGDWCIGPNAGHAVTSGRALAEEVLR